MIVHHLASLWLSAAVGAAFLLPSSADCNAVQIFLSRGHSEEIPGKQTAVVDAVCGALNKTCGFQSIAYNAHSGAETICQDQFDGISLAKADLQAYATRCPESRLVISGWSRGGALVTDVLAGGGGIGLAGTCEQPVSEPLDPETSPGDRISAVVTFGQLHHNANVSWNVGGGSGQDGLHPRTEKMLAQLSKWKDVARDYCHIDDPLCARGQDAAAHSVYFESREWLDQVVKFVVGRV